MKRILYYITDHGSGHATRSIAIIRKLKQFNLEIIVRNTNVQHFIQKSLPGIQVIPGTTDVGPVIKKDGYSIDLKKTKMLIEKWLDQIEPTTLQESKFLEKKEPNLIISDISVMPIIAANKLKIPSLAISNFSWYDVIENISDRHKLFLKKNYNKVDLALKLPLGTKMDHFPRKKKVNLVCREPTISKQTVKEKLGIDPGEPTVLFALNNKNIHLKCKFESKFNIISTGVKINSRRAIKVKDWIEGQDLVSASDLVICKCGYGMISECLSNGVPFLCLSDNNHLEQKAILNDLSNMNITPKISIEELQNLFITNEFIKSKTFIKQKNYTDVVAEHINQFIN